LFSIFFFLNKHVKTARNRKTAKGLSTGYGRESFINISIASRVTFKLSSYCYLINTIIYILRAFSGVERMRKKLLWIFFITLLIFSIPIGKMIGVTVAQSAVHDIAITSITLNRVATGELVNVTVVVYNNGTVKESFNVTLYYDSTQIENQNVTDLASSANTTLLFVWNTTDVLAETYTIKAVASQVDGETNILNNTLTSPITEEQVEIKSTYLAVVPQSTVDTNLTPGKNYTISIYTDYNGTDIWGYEFALTYNPDVLHGVEVTNGDLITGPNLQEFLPGDFDNTEGKLSLTAAFFKGENVTSGPGILANVTFTVVGMGDSGITLVERDGLSITKLWNPKAPKLEGIIINDFLPSLGHILHGYFRNIAEPPIHDIAVLSVKLNATLVVAGEPVKITIVVENQGTVPETFDVEIWYDYDGPGLTPGFRHIETKTEITLADGANKTLTSIWDTTDVRPGNHTVAAVAEEMEGETGTEKEDNIGESGEIEVLRREEPPIPIEPIIGIVVVAVVIAVVVYAVRRRKKPIPE